MSWKSAACRRAQVAFGAIFLLAVASSEVLLAKVGFDSFTPAQQDWFWERVDTFARFEAFLRYCGQNTNFEQRMAAAAQPCATPEAMAKVRAVFRRKVASYTHLNKPGICQMPGASALLVSIGKSLDSAVEDVVRACRMCTTC